jgi:hypothetical protein
MLDTTDDFNLETATKLGKLATALELDKEQRRNVKELMDRAHINPDDSVILWLCILAKFDSLTKTMNGDLLQQATDLVNRIEGKMGDFLRQEMKAVHSEMTALGNGLLKAAEATWRERLDDIIKQSRESEDARIRKANDDAQRLAFRKERDKHGIALAAVVVLLIGVGGLTYSVGKDIGRQESVELAQMWKRPDMPIWFNWMKFNDGRKLDAASCLKEQQFVVNGQPKCKVDIATAASLQSTTGLDGLVAIWREGVVKLGTWGLVGLGVIGTLLTQWTRRRLKKPDGAVA